jgi:hypothetical protein
MLLDPGVVFDLLQAIPLFGVQGEDVLDQVADLLREMVGELEIDVLDSFISFLVVCRLKGREAAAELKAKDS